MKKQFIIIAGIVLAFSACKKDSTPKSTQLLKKLTLIDNGDTTITNLTYDNSKKMTLFKANDGTESKFTYTGEKLTVLEIKLDANNKTKLEITYDGAKAKTAVNTIYQNNEVKFTYKVAYTTDASNRVTEILIKNNENTSTIGKHVFSYVNNNVSKIQSYVGETLTTTRDFTYGTKKSPFLNSNLKHVVDVSLAQFYSANEIVKQKYNIGNVEREIINSYTFDSQNFPLTANVSEKVIPSGTPEVTKLVFGY
ncbi:hypothetical protein [Pedobacter alpinus]|uniref:DUF4595 domain-containing protein n=1 Tax=Pedobacter alpinus TaxID=1590643 RepID=A0ABW5TXL4_9SPHI